MPCLFDILAVESSALPAIVFEVCLEPGFIVSKLDQWREKIFKSFYLIFNYKSFFCEPLCYGQ